MPVLRAMTEPEYQVWRAQEVRAYAADKVASGAWTAESAVELSRREHASLLPLGKDTPDNYLYAVVDVNEAPVGVLWFAVKERASIRIAYVYDIEIKPDYRRQGHAQRAFEALEAEVTALGLAGIALHVFGHNVAGRDLYAKLGYEVTGINMYKPLPHPGA